MTMTGTTAFEYELNESARAKHLSISVHPDGRVVVTKPVRVSQAKVEVFAQSRAAWVQSALEAFARKRVRHEKERAKLGMSAVEKLPKLRRGTKAYKDAVAAARALAALRLAHFNQHYHHPYGTISIRNQKTRWGSCSAKGNLSFSYKIAFLPSILQDYLIVHELCHVRQHNHSEKFWALVGETVPEYKKLRRQLRMHELA
jgi:predicted metal-dependent hydrolase